MTPGDDPEGSTAWVLMSVTVFQQWVDEHPDVVVDDWGVARIWTGPVYTPAVRWQMPILDPGNLRKARS